MIRIHQFYLVPILGAIMLAMPPHLSRIKSPYGRVPRIAPAIVPDRAIANVTITKSCKADAEKKRLGIQPGGGRIQACIKAHSEEFSEDCKESLTLAKLQQQ